MTKISLVVNDAGGGHRASAQALEAAIAGQCPNWQTDRVDVYRDILGLPVTYSYNLMLRLDWTVPFWPVLVPWFHWHKRLRQKAWLAKLQRYWQQQQPDLVVSAIPFVNRELYRSLQQVRSGIPFVILLTDLADDPPNFWLEAWQGEPNVFAICPTSRAMERALELGYPKTQLFETSGVVLHPRFYQPMTRPDRFSDRNPAGSASKQQSDLDRDRERQILGLDPDLTTAVLFFGGQGSNTMLRIADRLEASGLPLQLIFLCGKNQSLVRQLRCRCHRYPWVVEGFTDSIPYYLSVADFLIGKPGPGSLSEAIACNLPVITVCNSSTLWHERYNAQWIRERELGIVLPDFREIDRAVATLIQPQTLARYRANAGAIENRAIFEVVNILRGILNHD